MATIKDVAKLAGVSPSAVSKYFLSPDHMREKTRKQIASAVEALNYHPNQLARSLRNGNSNVIAVTVPDSRSPYFSQYIHLMQEACFKAGFIPLFIKFLTPRDIENAIQILRSGFADGIICIDDGMRVNQIIEANLHIPMVQISTNPEVKATSAVFLELEPGMELLCRHLEEQGAEHFSFIGSMRDYSSNVKLNTIRKYCQSHKTVLKDSSVFNTDNDFQNAYESGYEQCKRLLEDMKPLPDVIIAASDDTALGVLKCLIHNGFNVPEDILLSGHDDTILAYMSNPSITSVHAPLEEISAAAVENMQKLLNGLEPVTSSHPTTLTIRTSTINK
ncbi:MAG: LacI family DNA-binding transcriptional regulator [Eubacteriales bacterium]|nr:LacI family DNA-binding transcriptional regulator [Eubacteriales bacterium]